MAGVILGSINANVSFSGRTVLETHRSASCAACTMYFLKTTTGIGCVSLGL